MARLIDLRCSCGKLLCRWDGHGIVEARCPRCKKLMRGGRRHEGRYTPTEIVEG